MCTVAVNFLSPSVHYFLLFLIFLIWCLSVTRCWWWNALCLKKIEFSGQRRSCKRSSSRVQSRRRDSDISCLLEMFFIVCDLKKKEKKKRTMTTWQFEKQFVNKLSLLRIILQRKEKLVSCVYCHHPFTTSFNILENSWYTLTCRSMGWYLLFMITVAV